MNKLSDDRTGRTVQRGLQSVETGFTPPHCDSAPPFEIGQAFRRENLPAVSPKRTALFLAALGMYCERIGKRRLFGRKAEAPMLLLPTHIPPRDERAVEMRLDRFRAFRKVARDDVL